MSFRVEMVHIIIVIVSLTMADTLRSTTCTT